MQNDTNSRIIVENLSKNFRIGFKKNQSALERAISLFSGKEPKKTIQALKNISFTAQKGEIKLKTEEGFKYKLQKETKAIADQIDRLLGKKKIGAEVEKVEKSAKKIGERLILGEIKIGKPIKIKAKGSDYVSGETALKLAKNNVDVFVADVMGIRTIFKKVFDGEYIKYVYNISIVNLIEDCSLLNLKSEDI